MADVNNKLRLQIVTQLDAAGIKATKDQVDQLELGMRRAGNSGEDAGQKFGKLEKAIGNVPGPIGKIGEALGGLAGKATMVFGAFSLGVEIGNKIVDTAKKWGLMKDTIAELKKENAEYNRHIEQLKQSLQAVVEEEENHMRLASEAAEKSIKAIDDQTAAYFRQATALEGIKKAEGNAEMLQLQRAKFEDMKAYSDAGYTEAAEQLGKYYDVLAAELTAKQQIEEFDRGSVKLAKELSSAEESYAVAAKSAEEAKKKQAEAEEALHQHRMKNATIYTGYDNVWYGDSDNAVIDDQLEQTLKDATKYAEKEAAIAAKRAIKLENVDAKVLQRQMERANLVAANALGVDRAAQAYDDYTVANGNPLNAEVDESWAADLLRASQEADQTQKELLAEVKQFGERLERLLEVK